jgi:hypothetical protein
MILISQSVVHLYELAAVLCLSMCGGFHSFFWLPYLVILTKTTFANHYTVFYEIPTKGCTPSPNEYWGLHVAIKNQPRTCGAH